MKSAGRVGAPCRLHLALAAERQYRRTNLTVTEADFFSRLEYRLCREFAAVRPPDAPGLWCDGLIPTHWQIDSNPLTIFGDAWVGGLPGHHPARYQEKWRFVLTLYEQAVLPESIAWGSLLPDEDVRGWVVADVHGRRLVIALPANASVYGT